LQNYFIHQLDLSSKVESTIIFKIKQVSSTEITRIGVFVHNDTEDGMWEYNFIEANFTNFVSNDKTT